MRTVALLIACLGLVAALGTHVLGPTAAQWWQREIRKFRLYPHHERLASLKAVGDWRGVLRELDYILRIAPADEPARLATLRLLYGNGRYEALWERISEFLQQTPDFGAAHYYRGLAAFETGAPDAAAIALRRALATGGLTDKDRTRAKTLLRRIGLSQAFITVSAAPRISVPIESTGGQPDAPRAPAPDFPRPAAEPATPPPPAPPEPPAPEPMAAGFAALESGEYEAALRALERAETRHGDSGIIALYRGIALRALGRGTEAQAAFAVAADDETMKKTDQIYALREMGHIALADEKPRKAVALLEAATELDVAVPGLWLDLGYAYQAAGRPNAAADALAREVAAPAPARHYRNIGYLKKSAGRRRNAAEWFRKALDARPQMAAAEKLRLKQEVEWLEDRFDGSLYSGFRHKAVNPAQLSPLERSVIQSQGGLAAGLILPGLGDEAGRFLKLDARLFWAYEGHGLTPVGRSFQGAVGLSAKPFAAENVVFGLERLIPLGDYARSDWLGRVGYSWSTGLDRQYTADTTHRFAARFYAEGALINHADPDLFASAQMMLGEAWHIGSRVTIWPHVALAGTAQDDSYGAVSLLEGGPGIVTRLYFGEGLYRAYRGVAELGLQYRAKLAGDSAGPSGFFLTLQLQH